MTAALAAMVVSSAFLIGTPSPAAVALTAPTGVASTNTAATALIRPTTLVGFTPGNIISDAVFFNPNTMTEPQIQSFLESKVRSCRSGYTCLKDWYDTSRNVAANAMCGEYSGGWSERASTIIYRVAQACGINPQAILVTLQKEQGLVTHTEPSSSRYRIAMGQGCPDTAACDTRYYGFFNQVMGAAWQFKRYTNPPGTSNYFTWYPVGRVSNVGYNPNAACGSSPVFIQNRATAGLYYYTPYQPNAAALNAGYGLGDGCSAYGNRNFYNYFTDWFGSTQRDVAAEIEWEYQAQGGVGGLGAPVTDVLALTKNGGGFGRAYGLGSIYWSYSHGAKTVREGPIRDYYFARAGADGAMGWPMLNYQLISGGGINGQGQLFTGGSLYSSSLGTFLVRDPVRAGYFTLSGAGGALGWPTGDESCVTRFCRQQFQGGSVVSSGSGSFPVVDPVRSLYEAAGGPNGSWGVPLTGPTYLPYSGGGMGQAFETSSVYYRGDNRAFAVTGAIRDKYFALGGAAGVLGFPAGPQECANSSSCRQQFEFGWVIWSSAAGARVGAPAIDAAHAALGGATGALGASSGGFVYYPYNGGGFAEAFAKGAIFYKPAVGGAFALSGKIRDAYFATGGAAGPYGWPTSSAVCTADVCRQDFEAGSVVSTKTGEFWVTDPTRQSYNAAGGVSGSWGVPIAPLVRTGAQGGGFVQEFAGGTAYSQTPGKAFFVSGAVRARYVAAGGAAGALGFPIGDMVCINAGSCQQQFQFGWILWNSADGARIGDPAIDAAFAANGGSGGVLGSRITDLVYYPYNGGGFAQGFVNGAIFFKPGVGVAFAVSGSVRTAYFAAGGAAGRYGWPTSAMVCSAGTCTQNFEGGTIAVSG